MSRSASVPQTERSRVRKLPVAPSRPGGSVHLDAAALAGALAEVLQDGDGAVAGAVVAPVQHPVVVRLAQQAVELRAQPGGAVVGRQQDRNAGFGDARRHAGPQITVPRMDGGNSVCVLPKYRVDHC